MQRRTAGLLIGCLVFVSGWLYAQEGKASRNDLPGGTTVKAKTRWSKNRLVTKSTSEGPMGSMEVIEARSLSGDGKTMTVEFTMRAGPMDWERKLIYEKVVPAEPVK